MQKATLLTLALSVSALFASAQSYEAGKVYSIKNKKHSAYAAAMPQTNLMAVGSKNANLNLSELFTITPVDGSTNVYTIKPYVDGSKYVYYINTKDADANVGLTTTEGDNTKWIITTSSTDGYMLIKPGNGEGASWNKRGKNTDWNMDAIGQWIKNTNGTSADLTDDNKWAITEVTTDQVTAAITAYKNAYINFYANLSPIEDAKKTLIGYASNLNEAIEKAKKGTNTGATNSEVYNAAIKPNEVNWNLPVDGKVYKIYGLYQTNGETEKIYAGTKSDEAAKYYVAQKTSGTNVYRFVSTTADAEALTYNQKDFTVGATYIINLGALTLTYSDKAVAVASDGTLNHFTGNGNNTFKNNSGVKFSTEMYFEEATGYAGHEVTLTQSSDGKAYATLNLPFATTIPEGVTAYKKGESTGASVKLEEYKPTNNVLPANTPVLLQANEAGEKTFAPAAYVAKDNTTGFNGTLAATAVTGNAYILAKDGNTVKFCRLRSTNNTVNANKAYLTVPAASATALNFDFGGVATGIENAVADKANNAPIYDLSGRRVMNAVKGGIYIQNGKKFVK